MGIVPHMAAAIARPGGASAHERSRVPNLRICRRRLPALHGLEHSPRTRRPEGRDGGQPSFGRASRRDAILIDFLNPKLSIVFLACLPQFVSVSERTDSAHAGLSAVFMATTSSSSSVTAVRRRHPRSRHLASAVPDVDAADLRWRVRGARAKLALPTAMIAELAGDQIADREQAGMSRPPSGLLPTDDPSYPAIG